MRSDTGTTVRLEVRSLGKNFGLRPVISNLTFTLVSGDTLAITGENGSGKSTLMKLLANVAEKSSGEVLWSHSNTAIKDERLPQHLGFVSPYLQVYTEFTAWEHISLLQDMRGMAFEKELANELLSRFGLADRKNDLLGTFSSGMLQRIKFICALIHRPTFLLLDEPMTNFDEKGIAVVREMVAEGREERITVIATNDKDDLDLATKVLRLGAGKGVQAESEMPATLPQT